MLSNGVPSVLGHQIYDAKILHGYGVGYNMDASGTWILHIKFKYRVHYDTGMSPILKYLSIMEPNSVSEQI